MKLYLRYIELFAGIGGFRYGLEKANYSSQSTKTKCDKTEHIEEQECGGFRASDKGRRNSILLGQKQSSSDRNSNDNQKTRRFGQKKNVFEQESGSIGIKSDFRQYTFTCVYANEWDKYACQIYRKNFGKRMLNKDSEICKSTTEIRNKRRQFGKQLNRCSKGQYDCPELQEGDITKISAESIPDHEILTAGFPCPSYSIAGKRKGFKDPRGIVFFEICRIAKVKKPTLLLLENVKGLLNHDRGNTFRIILDSLSELGYDCEWEVLNSKNFGVPQNRERVFIVGHLRGKGGQKIFPLGKNGIKNKGTITSTAIDRNYWKGIDNHGQRTMIYWKNSKEKWVKENRRFTTVIKAQSDLCRRPLIKDYIQNPKLRNYQKKAIAGSLISSQYKEPQVINGIRKLTPIECERLQGFPDGWTEGISDTQRYKCLGNAVTTNVIEEIGKRIAKVQQEIF